MECGWRRCDCIRRKRAYPPLRNAIAAPIKGPEATEARLRILVTGGTGTFGTAFIRYCLQGPNCSIVSLSCQQHTIQAKKSEFAGLPVEFWKRDIRNRDGIRDALRAGFDMVIHAAAMKVIEQCDDEPEEALDINVGGTLNVIKEARLANVPKVLLISSDKACSPETTYGATKLMAEAIALGENRYRGAGKTRISVVRYGNVLGSQGSVLERFFAAGRDGSIVSLTHPDCTRYWWGIDDAVRFVWSVLDQMKGAEIWVPKLVSARVADLARAVAPSSPQTIVGMRGPEKIHESMINPTEAAYTWELPDRFVLLPKHGQWWSPPPPAGAVKVRPGFAYTSADDPLMVSVESHEDQPCASPL